VYFSVSTYNYNYDNAVPFTISITSGIVLGMVGN
jgi:hypothetical protein